MIMDFDELQNMDFDFDVDSFPAFCKYPFHGAFFRYAVDEDAPLDEQTDEVHNHSSHGGPPPTTSQITNSGRPTVLINPRP